jgi:hypothetical protein
MWGIMQLGPQEFVALEFAYDNTGNEQLHLMIHNGLFAIQRINPAMFEALREGYKALEGLDKDVEFTLPVVAVVNTSEVPEPETKPVPEWMNSLETAMKNFNPKDFVDDAPADGEK